MSKTKEMPQGAKNLYLVDQEGADLVREQACTLLGYSHFAELTVCTMIKQLVRTDRREQAEELLRTYCLKYQLTGPVARLMKQHDLFL